MAKKKDVQETEKNKNRAFIESLAKKTSTPEISFKTSGSSILRILMGASQFYSTIRDE